MTDRKYAVENLEKCLEAIRKLDDKICAWEEIFEQSALKQAKEIDNDPNSGDLKGMVIGIKDIFEYAGRAPGSGTQASPLRIPKKDALLVQQLKDAGAVIVGALKLTELCFFKPGPTANPHNLEHTPGGSSSGPAAAVAAGMVPVSIGSQSKGSTIRPASFCGIYGFKPSLGVCSMDGAMNLTYTMECPGIFARNVEDLIKVFGVLARPEQRRPPYNFHTVPSKSLPENLSIGVLNVKDHLPLDSEMIQTVDEYAQNLERLGHRVEWIDPPEGYDDVEEIYQGIFIPEVYDVLGYIVERGESNKIGHEIRGVIEDGKNATLRSYLNALHRRDTLAHNVDLLFDSYDILLLPAALGPAPKGLHATGDPICTTITSLLGIPAISVPAGVNKHKLPLGVQVIARRFNDYKLLSIAQTLPATIVKPSFYAGQ